MPEKPLDCLEKFLSGNPKLCEINRALCAKYNNGTIQPLMMSISLQKLLSSYRDAARTEQDKGTYFERPSIAFLTHDPVQVEQYEDVKPYSVWAVEQGWDGHDTGIDLVAKLRDEDGYPLELFQRVITVSLETAKIVRGLPKLDID